MYMILRDVSLKCKYVLWDVGGGFFEVVMGKGDFVKESCRD